MNTLLTVQSLTKQYGREKVVKDVSFSLMKNTSTALIGPNGAGKTTTLSMLTGLVNPSFGDIILENNQEDARRMIGFLPQYPKFFSWLSAIEFTEMTAKLSGVDARVAVKESEKILDFVGLGNVKKKKTGTFSGGMKQRLGLAQAIVHNPSLLLLDEPVSALDPVGRREILNLLKELQERTTILYSTHILNDAEEMTDQLLFLRNGELVEQGSLSDVREKYANPMIKIIFSLEEEAKVFSSSSPWNVKQKGSSVYIPIRENEPRMQEILAYASVGDWTVQRIEKASANLEEIFMQVVNKQ
ncbi:ABC transporter ATP-binding protein [uncultured Psychrobacillus sp.]|uniref:ABC transporter ATP-binding protein n=1 Tax=uncultured Psychrobacillus sp. TaxID=1551585 RepID=UPI00261319EB|nr:ABC transporter ATP-binding protein [uncultured Psychrobacillus sp.]